MKPLAPEQVLVVADEFCAARGVHVRSFAALTACAAVPGARIHGVPVCGSPREGASLLFDATMRLEPLSEHNHTFAAVLRDTYLRWCEA